MFEKTTAYNGDRPFVLLIHGLARTSRSMDRLANRLATAGFFPETLSYPSRKYPVHELLSGWILPRLTRHPSDRPLHMVTHSLGGVLALLAHRSWTPPAGSRMVLLAPPCRGSELVDHLRDRSWFRWFFGPAALELGTQTHAAWRNLLHHPSVPVGIIAGYRRIHPFWRSILPKPNDGTISVASTRWPQATAHRIVSASHPFIMNHPEVARMVIAFLRVGTFPQTPEETRIPAT